MAVYVKPCGGCPVQRDLALKGSGCSLREVYRKRVSGLGLRTAVFNCDLLNEMLKPGARIAIEVPQIQEGSGWEGAPEFNYVKRRVSATITQSRDGKYSALVDAADMDPKRFEFPENADPEKFRRRKQTPARRIVEFLHEPPREICEAGNVKLADGTCDRLSGEDCFCAMTENFKNGREF